MTTETCSMLLCGARQLNYRTKPAGTLFLFVRNTDRGNFVTQVVLFVTPNLSPDVVVPVVDSCEMVGR